MRNALIALSVLSIILVALGRNRHQDSLVAGKLPLRAELSASDRVTVDINQTNLAQALASYSELTGRTEAPRNGRLLVRLDEILGNCLSRCHIVKRAPRTPSGIEHHRDGLFTVGEVKTHLEALFAANRLVLVPDGKKHFRVLHTARPG